MKNIFFHFHLLASFSTAVAAHPGHGGSSLMELGRDQLRTMDSAYTSIVQDAGTSVIVVKRHFNVDIKACEQVFDGRLCLVRVTQDHGFVHWDYGTRLGYSLPRNHSLDFEVNANSYQIAWSGPEISFAEKIAEIKEVLDKLHPQLEAVLYREAYSEEEASLPVGTVLKRSPHFTETMLGKAIGVRRKISIRKDDCRKNFINDFSGCQVMLIARDNPDHPGSRFGHDVGKKKHVFSDGGAVEIETISSYESYMARYFQPPTPEPGVQILDKILEAFDILQGAEDSLFFEVYEFTPDDPTRMNVEPYKSGLVSDIKIADARYYKTTAFKTPKFETCKKYFNQEKSECYLTLTPEPVPYPSNVFEHVNDGEVQLVRFEGEANVVFGLPFENSYVAKFAPLISDKPILTPLEYLEKAFAELSRFGKDNIFFARIMVSP